MLGMGWFNQLADTGRTRPVLPRHKSWLHYTYFDSFSQ
jgi:hypothetical protein